MKIKLGVSLPGIMDMTRRNTTAGDGNPTVSEAFRQGFLDGLSEPDVVNGYAVYEEYALRLSYAEGANLGQALGRLYGSVTDHKHDRPGGEE